MSFMLTQHQQTIKDQALFTLDVNNRVLIKGSAGVGRPFLLIVY